MTLNTLFLGGNSVVDITTTDTTDEIKRKLATNFQLSRVNPNVFPAVELEDFGSNYFYYIKKNSFRIYFTKDLNRKIRHPFQGICPWFTGEIVDNGNYRLINGKIGLPEWTYYMMMLWFAICIFIYIGWTIKGDDQFKDGWITIFFLLFGLLGFLIALVRTRKRVDEMKDEIDRVLSNAC